MDVAKVLLVLALSMYFCTTCNSTMCNLLLLAKLQKFANICCQPAKIHIKPKSLWIQFKTEYLQGLCY